MTTRRICLQLLSAAGLASTASLARADAADTSAPLTFVDAEGVWRWQKDKSEVALYGVNYSLPSASAYRAAKRVGSDFKACIRRDLNHLKRMGQDAIRLCFWGDWENSTPKGELIVNEHLELLDYLVAEAKKRGFYMLLSPIVTYDAWWPDALGEKKGGFSNAFKKEDLGQARQPIQAQVTYLNAFLKRTNPLTGNTYGTEPEIVAVEPINEPWHHPDKPDITKLYLNIMARAVRSGGFKGPIFWNVTQDMAMAPFIRDEPLLAGATFAWYPEGLQERRPVFGNHLLVVDDYPQMRKPEFKTKVKMVYEFDSTMTAASYVFPAMARSFRQGGAQWATQFQYDAIDIAANNAEMNDHYLNLVYTAPKAIGALIAATAFKRLPHGGNVIAYPATKSFAGVELYPEDDLALLRDETRFYHTNSTKVAPISLDTLAHVAGLGSSMVVTYEGLGAYFLDKTSPGLWRLEVYPDVVPGANPYPIEIDKRDVAVVFAGARQMTVKLPDLGETFEAVAVDGKISKAVAGQMRVEPGVYYLRRTASISIPDRSTEEPYYCPPAGAPKALCRIDVPRLIEAGQTVRLAVLYTGSAPLKMTVGSSELPVRATGRVFHYEVILPAETVIEGSAIVSAAAGDAILAKATVSVTRKGAPIPLIDPARDEGSLLVPYRNWTAHPGVKVVSEQGASVIQLDGKGLPAAWEYVGQFTFDETLADLPVNLQDRKAVTIKLAKPVAKAGRFNVALIEFDGHGFTATVRAEPGQTSLTIPLSDFKPGDVQVVPKEFPKYIQPWNRSTPANAAMKLSRINAVQLRLGSAFTQPGDAVELQVAISGIELV
ncbi:hypothetical protein [Asticcacaulis sp. W401b]|uniref:hypothetical protein n=1 Tax=Asticcacaulis sp. W401b TaxID=3388666 RepID=UPI0039709CBA